MNNVLQDVGSEALNYAEIDRLNRLYDAMRLVNHAIVRQKSRGDLFAEVCRILVETGCFLISGIGWLNPETGEVVPESVNGDAVGYYKSLKVRIDDSPSGQGPIGLAFRTGEPYICNRFDQDPATQPWRELAAKAGIRSCATMLIRLGGTPHGVLSVYAGEEDVFQSKEIALLLESAADISFALDIFAEQEKRRLAESELVEVQARLRGVLDNLEDGLFVAELDGTLIDINATAMRVYGFDNLSEVPMSVGQYAPLLELRDLAGILVPFDQWPFPSILRGEKLRNRELRVRRTDCDWNRVFSYSGSKIESENGRELAFMTIRDITEQKLAEEALKASEAKLRESQRIAKLGSWELDLSDDSVTLSEEVFEITGLDRSVARLTFSDVLGHVHPEDREDVALSKDAAVAGLANFDLEHKIEMPSGQIKVVQTLATVIKDELGNPIRLSGTILDVSERHDLQSQLMQSQKMEAVGRLAGGIAHDFNNALAVIGGYSELLLDECLIADETGKGYVARIQAAHERAKSLTRQLLAFSRKQVVRPASIDVNTVVLGMEEMLQRLIGEDISLSVTCDQLPLVTQADKSQLEQVVMNLVINARDAMPQGGDLSIRTALVIIGPDRTDHHPRLKLGKYVMIRVRDTGSGMDEETISHVFEPFFTTKETGKGTGLGLSMVYGIVNQCGGTISVESRPAVGSCFTIYLPLKSAEGTAVALGEAAVAHRGGSETVLLVEDEESMRTLLAHSLKSHGYQVVPASDGMSALRIASEHDGPIHLLLSDVILPGLNGPEIGQRLSEARPGMKQLFMSGYTDDYIARSQQSISSFELLDKPFSMESLLIRIRAILDAA